jgi:hypothetical protein
MRSVISLFYIKLLSEAKTDTFAGPLRYPVGPERVVIYNDRAGRPDYRRRVEECDHRCILKREPTSRRCMECQPQYLGYDRPPVSSHSYSEGHLLITE